MLGLSAPGWAQGGDPPPDLAALRAQAESLAAEGRCAAALDAVAELRAAGREDADLLVLAGTCAAQLRRFDAAAEQLRAALRREPGRADAHLRLAIALYHLGDADGARAELSAAAAPGEEPAELLLYRGLLLLDEERGAEAAEALEQAR
ncbi:MAG TPA: tetratricopeptide repeat protein, partial [Myxococcota bacterium]|nr:tetratricopeptide repeat protein [Myxococcota bacterium]